MKKINRIGIKDILIKRQNQITNKSASKKQDIEDLSVLNIDKHVDLTIILQKLSKFEVEAPTKCELNNDEKITLIQAISQRQNISLNIHTLIYHLTVWKVPPDQQLVFVDQNSRKPNQTKQDYLGNQPFGRNYYILQGKIQVYEDKVKKRQNLIPNALRDSYKKQKTQSDQKQNSIQNQEQDKIGFTTEMQAMKKNKQKIHMSSKNSNQGKVLDLIKKEEPIAILEQMTSWGSLFGGKEDTNEYVLVAKSGIFIQIKNPQIETMLINQGGMDQSKKFQIIQKFPIFQSIGRKMQSILPFIGLKKFTRNQFIYKIHQKPTAFYLIIRGQVVFQIKIEKPSRKTHRSFVGHQKNHGNGQVPIQTEALGAGNYFGQQQIINPQQRKLNALCHSAECDLLQIPIEKFEKLLAYSDFSDAVRYHAEIRVKKREQKIGKSLQLHYQFWATQEANLEMQDANSEQPITNDDKNHSLKQSRKKRLTQPVRIMHGNVIKSIPKNINQPVSFSMLAANPDMYAATLKKFRKYTMKQPEKTKPEVNWNLKRVWKVLNLENVLRQDTQGGSPQGKAFFESHRRLQNHVQQMKSMRPKTSSSTYRTKLQYIAYLKQFNE